MTRKDLRPEQVKLLRFEKLIVKACRDEAKHGRFDRAAILAALPALAAAGASAADKLGADAPLTRFAELEAMAASASVGRDWLMELAATVSAGHSALEALAASGSWLYLQIGGGTPKTPPVEQAASLLMNGPF